MTTANAIILQALKISGVTGVGQTAQAEDLTDALFQINAMLAQWSRKRWLNTDLTDAIFTSTGVESYSIGAGGDINTPRPDKIQSAFVRINGGYDFNVLVDGSGNTLVDGSGNVLTDGTFSIYAPPASLDYPLQVLQSREDYNTICMKGMVSFPSVVFYDSAYPLGRLFVWPVPQASIYQIHLSLKVGIAQITDPTADIALPPEYTDALMWCLAQRQRPMYGLQPDPSINAGARAALNTIRVANSQIPTMQMPGEFGSRRHGTSLAAFTRGFS